MSRIKNILFGKIAVSTKFITDEQLDECLQEQVELESRGEKVPRLGEMLESKGYLTKRQIRSLLETMQSMQRRLFGEIATSFQFVTLDQVQTCLEIQRHLKEPQESVPLFGQSLATYKDYAGRIEQGEAAPPIGELMVAMGFLKEHQVNAVLEEQNKKIVECENCEASLNVTNFSPGQKVKCGQCHTVLQIVQNDAGELEAALPHETPEEQGLPTEEEKVESFAESSEPLLAEDEDPAQKAANQRELLQADEAADSDLRLVKPTTLGDFRVISKLGQDSTGTLYKAEQISKHRVVVLKLMNKSTMGDSDFSSRFVSEAKKVAGLDHKNIKRIFSLGKIGDRYFVAQEFVEGESVHKLLDRESRLPYTRAMEIAVQVAEALDYAWKRQVPHHDLRPSNIMILPTGGVKVAQLGLASKSTENILTISKSGALAPFYIAPEIVTEDRALDHRTDIYALGAILFHMITGRPPYQGSSPFEILVRLTEETIPPLKFFDPSIPDPVCQIVERMLQAEPDDRYQSYGELLQDLKAACGLAATYGGEIPKDMEDGIVKSRRFTPIASPSPLTDDGTRKVPVVEDETQAVDEKRLAAAKQAAKSEAAKQQSGRGASSVKSFDPRMAMVGVAIIGISIGGFYYFGGKPVNLPFNGGQITDTSDPFSAVTKTAEADPTNFAAILQACKDFTVQNPGKHEAEVKELVRKTTESQKSAIALQIKDIDKEVGDLLTALQYDSAYHRWDSLPDALACPEAKQQVEAQKAETMKKIRAAIAPELEKAMTLAKTGDCDGACSAVDVIKAQLGTLDEAAAVCTECHTKIEAERKAQADATAKKEADEKNRKALEACNQVGKQLQIAARTLNFNDLSTRFGNITIDQMEGTTQLDRFNELKFVFETLQEFRSRVASKATAHITGLTDNTNFAKNPVVQVNVDGKQVNAKLLSVTEDGFDVQMEEGNAQKSFHWSDLPAESIYQVAADFCTASGSSAEHVALGVYCMNRELNRQAEAAFNRAVQLGEARKTLEKYFTTLTEIFNKQADGLVREATAALDGNDQDKGIMALLSLRNDYSDTDYTRKNGEKIDKLFDKAFLAMAGPKGRVLSFMVTQDLAKWKQSGDGKWNVNNGTLLAEGGKSLKLDGEEKGVEELSFLFRINQDDATKLLVKVGEYKLTLDIGNRRANGSKGGGLRNGTASLQIAKWHVLRMRRVVEGGNDVFRIAIDGRVIHEFKEPGNRDGIQIEIQNRKSGNLEFDNLVIRNG